MAFFRGIDVSKWNGSIDFTKVKNSGYDFVIIRAGYGKVASQKDENFETNYKNAKSAGLNVGAYWYSYATTTNEAKVEAKLFIECLKGKSFEYPVYVDIEEQKTLKTGKTNVTNIINAFCLELENAGYFAGFYMSRSPLQTYVISETAQRYALWIAEYSSECKYSGDYGIWQYSSNGKISGVSGNVDVDYSYVDYPNIIKKKGLNGFSKTTSNVYTSGTKVTLKNATVYASSTATSGTKKSGTYYIYDSTAVNGRYRITNLASNCGKTPVSKYVTGWVSSSEIVR